MKGLQALQAALIIAFLCSLGQGRHIIQTKLENAKSKRETCPIQCGFMFEANQNFIRSLKKIHQPGKKNNAKAPKMELYRMVVSDDVCSIHYIFYRAIGFKKNSLKHHGGTRPWPPKKLLISHVAGVRTWKQNE